MTAGRRKQCSYHLHGVCTVLCIMACNIMMTKLMTALMVVILLRPTYSYLNSDIPTDDEVTTEPLVADSVDFINGRAQKKVFLCGRREAFTSPRKQNVANKWQYGNNPDIHSGDEPVEDRILGGLYAKHGDNPWQVNILYASSATKPLVFTQRCGGAILNEFWVITVAHCVRNIPSNLIKVTVGDHYLKRVDEGEQSFCVDRVIVNEHYKAYSYAFDIALIKIKPIWNRGIQFGDFVQPVCLANTGEILNVGRMLRFSGWGEISPFTEDRSQILKQTEMPIISNEDCHKFFKVFEVNSMVCVRGKRGNTALCMGDDGGPAVYNSNGVFILYGIVILGPICSAFNIPVAFSSIPSYRYWIDENILRFSNNPNERAMPTRTARG